MEKLGRVLALRVQQAQTTLAAINAEETDLRAALAQLARPVSGPMAEGTDYTGGLAGTLAEVRWQRWADARRQALHMSLAQILARKADARQGLAQAVGKDAALAALVTQAKQKQRRDQG
jgi:hypothetical protein